MNNLIGRKIGKLKIITRADNKNDRIYWNCICDCGRMTIVYTGNLTSKKPTESCGCLSNEQCKKMGLKNNGQLPWNKGTKGIMPKMSDFNKKNLIELNKTIHKLNFNTQIFTKKAKKIHGNLYDYSKVDYKNSRTNISIICKNHGIFQQTPMSHLSGSRCYDCAIEENSKNRYKSQVSFISDVKKIHGDLYDYSKVTYKGVKNRIDILCKKHGFFSQFPRDHLKGCGCPKCNYSKGESNIFKILDDSKHNFFTQHKFKDCKNKTQLKFDFYLPELNICIEFDGIQHFEPREKFGGKNSFLKVKENDNIKNRYCLDNNIPLLRIKYTDKNLDEILFNFINKIKLN